MQGTGGTPEPECRFWVGEWMLAWYGDAGCAEALLLPDVGQGDGDELCVTRETEVVGRIESTATRVTEERWWWLRDGACEAQSGPNPHSPQGMLLAASSWYE